MVYQIMHNSVDGQDTRWFLVTVHDRQVPVSALGHRADRVAHRGGARNRCGRTRHDFANGSRQIGPARHLLQRVAFSENADQLRAVANHDCTRALRTQKLHAALDVYEREPLPADHPLRSLDNVTLSPHLGYVHEDNYRIFYRDTVENVAAFLAGKPIRVINA